MIFNSIVDVNKDSLVLEWDVQFVICAWTEEKRAQRAFFLVLPSSQSIHHHEFEDENNSHGWHTLPIGPLKRSAFISFTQASAREDLK
mmetsp:Transcript_6172/g.12070  ORF Transcript_6172/g.12070 Transcript_6172/m.12070 type:complete len:88 (+) Transcript_6172:329-592(+)